MSSYGDPLKQIGYLQQCLSSDKKPLGFLIGAGCPVAIKAGGVDTPLIPDIDGITTAVRDSLIKCPKYKPRLKIIDDHFRIDGHKKVNIETLLSHIRSLRKAVGNDKIRDLSADDLDKLDEKICELISELVNKTFPNAETPYHSMAAWINAINRDKPIEIFTSNYDVLMEQALEAHRVPYFDGFAGVHRPFFDLRAMEEDMLPSRWARLWKLHGSINWFQEPTKPTEGVFRYAANAKGLKCLIHPSHLKYEESRRMPYFAMIDKLRAFFKNSNATLIICGYSFRDEHLNEVIVQGLQCTQTAIAFGLLFGDIGGYEEAVKLARRCSNLSLLAKNAAVISGQESKWPEKEKEAISVNNVKWIKWEPVDPTKDNSKLKAEFGLGDFALFGQFLHELIGNLRSLGVVNGE